MLFPIFHLISLICKNMDLNSSYRNTDESDYLHVNSEIFPQVLVFSWDQESDKHAQHLFSIRSNFRGVLNRIGRDESEKAIQILSQNNVVACVLFISKNSLEDYTLFQVVKACTGEISLRQDFRLFVHPVEGLTFLELRQMYSKFPDRNEVIKLLIENVHIPNNLTESNLDYSSELLQNYLNEIPQIRNHLKIEIRNNRWNSYIKSIFNLVSNLFLISSIVFLFWGTKFIDTLWFPFVLVCVGYLLFYSTIALISLFKGLAPDFLLKSVIVFVGLVIYRDYLASASYSDLYLILAGFLIGFQLDYMRRHLVSLRRENVNIKPIKERTDLDFLNSTKSSSSYFTSFFEWPLVPSKSYVFLSYSDSSQWGVRVASDIHEKLVEFGVSNFFAPNSIEPGCSWRHNLKEGLTKCSVFIFIMDKNSINSEWALAELASASKQQQISGQPLIVALYPPELTSEVTKEKLKLFFLNALAKGGGTSYYSEEDIYFFSNSALMKQLEYVAPMADSVVEEIGKRWNNNSIAVFPLYFAAVLELILLPIDLLLYIVGVLGSFIVWIAFLIILWYKMSGNEAILILVKSNLQNWALILTSFWIGILFRFESGANLDLRFDNKMENKYSKGAALWRRIEVFLLIIFYFMLIQYTIKIWWLYSIIVCVFGIILGNSYIKSIRVGKDYQNKR